MKTRALLTPQDRFLLGAVGAGGCAVLVEGVSLTGLVDPGMLPRFSTVVVKGAELAVDPDFLGHVGATWAACGIGLFIAVCAAVPAGLLLGSVPGLERALRPLLEFLRPIPPLSLAPLATFLWAENQDAKIALIVFACSWPLLINTLYGLMEVDPLAKETLRSFGFGPLRILYHVSLPSTAPFIATGLRIAVSVSLAVAVSVELVVGGVDGIGTFIAQEGSANIRDGMLAGALWAGALGLAANMVCDAVGRHLFQWHRSRTERT
ncbi:ABC transporter permease [Nonomuraea sp. NPDC046802]|uniref:ABC transporter permease n=1 Tax=Nonomuraea sp. NPDC046802 TaxID=3154919 RepID=UPI0033F23E0C